MYEPFVRISRMRVNKGKVLYLSCLYWSFLRRARTRSCAHDGFSRHCTNSTLSKKFGAAQSNVQSVFFVCFFKPKCGRVRSCSLLKMPAHQLFCRVREGPCSQADLRGPCRRKICKVWFGSKVWHPLRSWASERFCSVSQRKSLFWVKSCFAPHHLLNGLRILHRFGRRVLCW